jgi:hypothetical protein
MIMTVVLIDRGDDVVVCTASLWRRLSARLRADHWDRELSRGASPDSSVERSLRAEQLARPAQRRVIARALRRAVDGGMVRSRITTCQDVVLRLAARVESSQPISPRGLAMVHLLVTDGTGPLHYRGRPAELRQECLTALAALDPTDDLRSR